MLYVVTVCGKGYLSLMREEESGNSYRKNG